MPKQAEADESGPAAEAAPGEAGSDSLPPVEEDIPAPKRYEDE